MQCPNCKNEVTPGELFCDNCGHDLRDLMQNPIDHANAQVVDQTQTSGTLVPDPPDDSVIAAESSDQPPVPPQPVATAVKLIIKDSGASYDLSAGHELIIGRTDPIEGIYPDIDLTAHDTATGVSRRHATLHEQGGQWFVKDLNSTNYTVVNRQRVNPDQELLLSDGDEIRFGRVVTIFQCA